MECDVSETIDTSWFGFVVFVMAICKTVRCFDLVLEFLVVCLVTFIQSLCIALDTEMAIDNRIFRRQIGLVKVVHMFHMCPHQTYNINNCVFSPRDMPGSRAIGASGPTSITTAPAPPVG